MNIVRKLKFAHRLALLLLVLGFGLLAYGFWSYKVVGTVRVGGPIYEHIINSQELVSDVLPPPLYIIESYLLCLQMTSTTNAQEQKLLEDRLKEKQEDYKTRHAHWTNVQLSPELQDKLLVKSHAEAMEFYTIAQTEFTTALFANDRVAIDKAISKLGRTYERHRKLIDKVVELARTQARLDEGLATEKVALATSQLSFVLVLVVFAGIAIAAVIHKSIVDPISQSLDIANKVVSGNYIVEGPYEEYPDEAGALLEALRKMSASLKEGVDTIAARDANLRHALDHIVEKEKLAAMGAIVAGVAHELNTPLGNVLLAATTQGDRLVELENALIKGSLSKSELSKQLNEIRDMTGLVERNLKRMSEVIESFKQVASEQAANHNQQFDLHTSVNDALKMTEHFLRNGQWSFQNQVPNGIVCNSFRGPLEQVLSILVQNAVEHGYRGKDTGAIIIRADQFDDYIDLSVSDNGVGLESLIQQRVFEPFFTTTFGRGKSGLGLAIAYRICTTTLSGGIRVESAVSQGATFTVRIPNTRPV